VTSRLDFFDEEEEEGGLRLLYTTETSSSSGLIKAPFARSRNEGEKANEEEDATNANGKRRGAFLCCQTSEARRGILPKWRLLFLNQFLHAIFPRLSS